MTEKKRRVDGTFAEGWKPTEEGETFTGVYLGVQEAIGTRGSFKAYHFKTEDGQRISVSGASLNTIMPQIPRKTQVTVTYVGMELLKTGNKMRRYEIEIPADVQLIDPFEDDED